MPKDNIERAIAKGTGEGVDADQIETVVYEGYGPGGVALLIEALTDNRNRTGADVRHLLAKHGGNLGEPGSVSYLFDKQGVIVVDANRYNEDDLMPAIDAGAQDISLDDDVFEVLTEPGDLVSVQGGAHQRGRRDRERRRVTAPEVPSAARRGRCRQAAQADRRARGVRRHQRGTRELRRRGGRPRADRVLGRGDSVARRAGRRRGCLTRLLLWIASLSPVMNLKKMLGASFALALVAGVTACGSSSSSSTASGVQTAPSSGSTQAAIQTTPTPPPQLAKKPVVNVPKGSPPSKLITKDLITGTGATATAGKTVTVNYVGVLYKGGKQFDSSWQRNQPFTTALSQGSVIPGWVQGINGMKVGGRRELIIPPSLGYGAKGSPPTIPANSTLVFVVDLLKVQ